MKIRSDFTVQKQIVATLGGSKESPVDIEHVSTFKTVNVLFLDLSGDYKTICFILIH